MLRVDIQTEHRRHNIIIKDKSFSAFTHYIFHVQIVQYLALIILYLKLEICARYSSDILYKYP